MQKKPNSNQIDWWNEVARKLDGYQGGYKAIFDGNSGEEDFVELVKEKLKKHPLALDVACADGKFTTEIAPHAKRVTGIDLSPVMIEKAKNGGKRNDVEFMIADAKKLPFADGYFDLVISRRGPVSQPGYLEEAIRVAKPGGVIMEITIGDQDAIEFKKIFNRGQGFSASGESRYEEIKKRLQKNEKIKIKEIREYFCDVYYPTVEDIVLLLSSTPIIDDFDLNKDYQYLETIEDMCKTEQGIRRTYHRLIWVIQKKKA